jgi:hypothetical protein
MTATMPHGSDRLVWTVDHLATARRYAANPHDWPLAPRFNPHERWYHRLAAGPDGEVWVLTWLPGQATDLHDHGGSAGAFLVVSGALTEHTFAADRHDRQDRQDRQDRHDRHDRQDRQDRQGRQGRQGRQDRQGRQPQLSHGVYHAGQGRSFGRHHIHQVGNTGTRPAVSLHVYSPALREMTRYHVADGRLVVTAVERTGADW